MQDPAEFIAEAIREDVRRLVRLRINLGPGGTKLKAIAWQLLLFANDPAQDAADLQQVAPLVKPAHLILAEAASLEEVDQFHEELAQLLGVFSDA